MKKNFGFTLVELMTVIAIIAVLTAIVISGLSSARAKSRDTRRISDISNLQLALALYLNKNGAYPAALSSLAPTYIAAVPTDPKGTNYGYCIAASSKAYCLGASLEMRHSAISFAELCTGVCSLSLGGSNIYRVTK